MKCQKCGKTITKENVRFDVPPFGKFRVFCKECYKRDRKRVRFRPPTTGYQTPNRIGYLIVLIIISLGLLSAFIYYTIQQAWILAIPLIIIFFITIRFWRTYFATKKIFESLK